MISITVKVPLFVTICNRTMLFVRQFLGIVSLDENNVEPIQSLSTLPVDDAPALFIETASLMMVAIGGCYTAFGLCCGQRYLTKVRKDYADRLEERKRIFEVGLRQR